ncbi:hypothetical protein [Angustibacter peucedani]
MTAQIVLSGRSAAVAFLEKFLSSGDAVTTIASNSIDEVCAFVAAVAVHADSVGVSQMLARLAFVDDPATWRRLTGSSQPLVLVPLDPTFASELPPENPHSIVVPVAASPAADLVLPPLNNAEVSEALREAGVSDRERAESLGRLARRSLTGLRRHLATNAALHRPAWAENSPPRYIRAAVLANSWLDQVEADRRILEALSGVEYEEIREALAVVAASHAVDPLLMRTGDIWHLVSSLDAWTLLVSELTDDDIKRFEQVVLRVLCERDPALDLGENARWQASIQGKRRAHSNELRRGLAESLALLGMLGEDLTLAQAQTGTNWANYLVRRVLEWAGADTTGQSWCSLADVLPLLAEAAPDAFLDAVSASTSGDHPILTTVFTDTTEGSPLFSPSSAHSSLLWALETVSWSTEHFGRAVDLLARLDELDPGGRLSNRPSETLNAIFRPWHPDNAVSVERRLRTLDSLRRRHPTTAWKLQLAMLPASRGAHFPISAPTYRDWKPATVTVTYEELWSVITGVVERCCEDATAQPGRWLELLDHISDLSAPDRAVVLRAFTSSLDTPQAIPEDVRESAWRSLRETVGKHREFATAQWALPEEELTKIDDVASLIAPKDAYTRLAPLFENARPFLGEVSRRDDYSAYDRALADRRAEAISEIVAEGGLAAARRIAGSNMELTWAVGTALARACPGFDLELLPSLDSDDASEANFGMMYFGQRYRDEGVELVRHLLADAGLSTRQRARLLLVARDDLDYAWESLGEQPEVETLYWQWFQPYGLGADFGEVEEVARRLMRVGRHAAALDFLGLYFHRAETPPELGIARLIVEGLDGLLASEGADPETQALSRWDFEQIFAYLEATKAEIGIDVVARLQWAFLPALGFDAEVPTLSERLGEDPEFFVSVLCAVYRARPAAEDEDSATKAEDAEPDSATDPGVARNAYQLLDAWNHPPGLVAGAMDAEVLRTWLAEARRLLDEVGRTEVGLQHVGQVLASTPPDEDESWPGAVVRDLIEDLQLEQLELGFYLRIINSRGVTSRGLEDGGAQEEALVAKYQALADRFSDEAPRTAAVFRRIASSYRADARQNEDQAERFRRGLR